MQYTDPTHTEDEVELTGMELVAEHTGHGGYAHTGRPITVDGFAYTTTAPVRMRRQSARVEHYGRMAEEAGE